MDKKNKFSEDDSSDQPGYGESMTSTDFEAPFVKKFPDIPGEELLPCIENDFSRAKAYLMQQCLSSGDNLWDHLNDVLEKILVERPTNIGCTFEEFSYKVRECRFRAKTDHLLDVYVPPRHYSLSQKRLQLLQLSDDENPPDKSEGEEEENKTEFNIMNTFYYFRQGGVALPEEELFCIGVHLKKLQTTHSLLSVRFWGKILGTRNNYYVAETELTEDGIAKLNAEQEEEAERIKLEQQEKEAAEEEELRLKKETAIEEANEREMKLAEERNEAKYAAMVKEAKAKGLSEMPERKEASPWPPIPPLPVPVVKKSVEIPPEPVGTGPNRKVYFVCRQPGEDWIQLPEVTPQQITAARKVKRAFTGDLESDVITFPTFPGKEKNFLRAQIARISAGTHISPLGFFTFNEEEEEEEEEAEAGFEGKTSFVINQDFEPVGIRDLIDSSMAFWVHHTPYILEQGRTVWWSPSSKGQAGEDVGEVEEEDEIQKEVGPALLTPLSEDSAMDAIVPWSVRKTSAAYPEHSVAFVRSNLWPGAYAYATEKKFDNVYIGYGHKFSASNHSPAPIQDIQEEYPIGPEIMEIRDPTPEEEEEWRLAHAKKNEDVEEEEEEVEDDADIDEDEDEDEDE